MALTRRQALVRTALGAAAVTVPLTASLLVFRGPSASVPSTPSPLGITRLVTGTVAVRPSHRTLTGPPGARLMTILADPRWTEPLPIAAWLVRHPEGDILVDTGETPRVRERGWFPSPVFRRLLRYEIGPEDDIARRLRAAGSSPDRIRRVVLTHLHTDHTGGLAAFPGAEVLVTRPEYEAARRGAPGTLPSRWPDPFRPVLVDFTDGPWRTFDRSRVLTEAGDVRLVPTPGHTAGHMSVVVERGDAIAFIAGDASFDEAQMRRGEVAGICQDLEAARDTLDRIRGLVEAAPVVYLPTHDADAGRRLAAAGDNA